MALVNRSKRAQAVSVSLLIPKSIGRGAVSAMGICLLAVVACSNPTAVQPQSQPTGQTKALRCDQLSRQLEAALSQPVPKLGEFPNGTGLIGNNASAYNAAVNAYNQRVANANAAYNAECNS